MSNPMKELYDTIITRKDAHAEGSYTNYLFEKGLDKILKKVVFPAPLGPINP